MEKIKIQEQGTYIVQEKVGWWIFSYWKDVAVFDSLQQADTYIKNNYQLI